MDESRQSLISTVQLLYTVKERGGKPDSLWFKKSIQKPQIGELSSLCPAKLYVHEYGFRRVFVVYLQAGQRLQMLEPLRVNLCYLVHVQIEFCRHRREEIISNYRTVLQGKAANQTKPMNKLSVQNFSNKQQLLGQWKNISLNMICFIHVA